MGGESTYPKMVPLDLTHSHLLFVDEQLKASFSHGPKDPLVPGEPFGAMTKHGSSQGNHQVGRSALDN